MKLADNEKKSAYTKLNGELDTALSKLRTIEYDFTEQSKELVATQERLKQNEAAMISMKECVEKERAAFEARLAERIEDGRSKWRQANVQSPPAALQQLRTTSPASYTRKSSSADLLSLQNRRLHAPTEPMHVMDPAVERPLSRHGCNTLRSLDVGTPNRQDSLSKVQHTVNATVSATPSIQTWDHDDYFDASGTPASPLRTINDMTSVSTAGAGPSVQLVERMSATIRRLESEKAALQDDIARLSSQRDEARGQVVSLMGEVEQKRAADMKIQNLEEQIAQVNERYQTTLEMLGEKSELVEELKADVADLKKIYRELVDSTMR